MAKLDRKQFLTYLDSQFNNSLAASWVLIGADLESLNVEMNPDTEQKKNILGENSVKDNGYNPTMSIDPYYIDDSDGLGAKIQSIALDRKYGDNCKTRILEVVKSGESPYTAWQQEVSVKPTSYGGDTSGFQAPLGVTFSGNRVKGTVTFAGNVPTFTAGE